MKLVTQHNVGYHAFRWLVLSVVCGFIVCGNSANAESRLSPRNTAVPFPYLIGESREWPILEQDLPAGTQVELTARQQAAVLATGNRIEFRGLSIALTPAGRLRVTAQKDTTAGAFQLSITLKSPGQPDESQTLELRPAPPDRPITYYADFGDDLIRLFMSPTGQFSPATKSGFDEYFRRLQAHGTRNLIVWLSPFPYIADPANYPAEDWQRYEQQARAILNDATLTKTLTARTDFQSWGWLRYLMAARLDPQFGKLLGESAKEHGISMAVSFRPFEAALTKYYEVPTFADDGTYLWGFLPLASPTVNYHPDKVGWRHYREILREVGQADAAELTTMELPGVTNPQDFGQQPGLQITASPVPPLADDSLVLVRGGSNEFQLRPFATIREAVGKKFERIEGFRVEAVPGGLRLAGLKIPRQARYLTLSWTGSGTGPDLASIAPVILKAKAGNRLGRETTYWVTGDANDQTRVAGITANGEYRSEFDASKISQIAAAKGPERLSLKDRQLVIDLGDSTSVEMIDFNQPLARDNAVREIATILKQPGFDGILINTRSHVDLPLSIAVGSHGQHPAGQYWNNGWSAQIHLGLDKAYVPRSTESLSILRDLTQKPAGVEQITTWQPNEWTGECQTPQGPKWRYARNRGTADGVRLLLEDLERTFPKQRIRVLFPPTEAAVNRIWEGLDTLEQPTGGKYGRGYYYQLWPSNNHNPAVGEGLAMVNLSGLSIEPAFMGSGSYLPGAGPFELYVREYLADLAGNHGSKFRGPRTYFYEGQTTLRATDRAAARKGREDIICHLLAQQKDINEVILYEAADWLYFLSLADVDLSEHRFLERCQEKKAK